MYDLLIKNFLRQREVYENENATDYEKENDVAKCEYEYEYE